MRDPGSNTSFVSVVVPTIGRPDSLRRLLASLKSQSYRPFEVIVADGSENSDVQLVIDEFSCLSVGLNVRCIPVHPPNAVRQRMEAIAIAKGDCLLLLDDDVILESDCVAEMVRAMAGAPDVVAVVADFNNQTWAMPTRVWRFYLKRLCGLSDGEWQGRVIGPLLRFGYNPSPAGPMPMEWLGAGMSLIKTSAYQASGGFSDFFLRRCTTNEDVDLGIKLTRHGSIILCPTARLGHFHASGGRLSPGTIAEDDLYNRYLIMRHTQSRSSVSAFGLVSLYFAVETASNLGGCVRRIQLDGFFARTYGRLCAMLRIILLSTRTQDETSR